MARGQRRELRPHPGPTQATSPLTCCAIPGRPPPPTDAAASACKSSPTAPVIPVLPTHAPLPGLLRPNLPWELLPRKKDASDNCKQKCTRGTWSVPRLFVIKALLSPKRNLLCTESRLATASCELPVAQQRSPGSQVPTQVPGYRLPDAGSPPWQPELKIPR